MRLILTYHANFLGSLFPKVDDMLQETEYQQSLEYVASRKNMNRYRTMLDFLFCEIFVEYKHRCFRFYETGEIPLRDMISKHQIKQQSKVLVQCLKMARKLQESQEAITWRHFRGKILETSSVTK